MLDNDAHIVARLDHYLFHHTFEHGPDFRIWVKGNFDSVLRRELKILIYRMITFPEMVNDRACCRPWKLTLVLCKL